PDFFYDEVATHRKMEGVDQVIACWKEWATAFPDSTATFHNALVSGNTVVVEVNEAVYQLNHRPRKCLQYRTPHEVFFGLEIRPIKLPEVALCT
ncbi:MAG: nuclear transport factor 2 family protein, partial [Polaromonas sp.]